MINSVEVSLIILVEYGVLNQFGSHKLVNGYHQSWELLDEIGYECVICLAQQTLDLLWKLSVMVFLVSDKSQKISKERGIILSEAFLQLCHQARIELSWPPNELIDDFVLFAYLVELNDEWLLVVVWTILLWLVLQLVTNLLNDLELFVVTPKENMINDFCRL